MSELKAISRDGSWASDCQLRPLHFAPARRSNCYCQKLVVLSAGIFTLVAARTPVFALPSVVGALSCFVSVKIEVASLREVTTHS
jgi:hypothetical protein